MHPRLKPLTQAHEGRWYNTCRRACAPATHQLGDPPRAGLHILRLQGPPKGAREYCLNSGSPVSLRPRRRHCDIPERGGTPAARHQRFRRLAAPSVRRRPHAGELPHVIRVPAREATTQTFIFMPMIDSHCTALRCHAPPCTVILPDIALCCTALPCTALPCLGTSCTVIFGKPYLLPSCTVQLCGTPPVISAPLALLHAAPCAVSAWACPHALFNSVVPLLSSQLPLLFSMLLPVLCRRGHATNYSRRDVCTRTAGRHRRDHCPDQHELATGRVHWGHGGPGVRRGNRDAG